MRSIVQPYARKKTGSPMWFELSDQTRLALDDYVRLTGQKKGRLLFAGRGDSSRG
jgi:hypothetical protein